MSIGDDMANNKNKNQEELVLSILKKNQSLMKVLDYIDTLQIPDYYIAAGSIYQTIWNGLDHRDLNYGIKDIDVIYYNSNDLSVETDLKLYEKITEFVTKEKIPYTIDVSNEARMHIFSNDSCHRIDQKGWPSFYLRSIWARGYFKQSSKTDSL